MWLTLASTFVARHRSGKTAVFETAFKVFGYAHLPLLLLALTIQVVSVGLQFLGPAWAVALFVVLFWFPALLVGAARTVFGVDTSIALQVISLPYIVWLAVVGGYLYSQLGHLL